MTDLTTASSALIDLAPADWLWATWRRHEFRERPAPRAFDLQECAKRLGAFRSWNWDGLNLPDSLTREEAEFWFRAMTRASFDVKPRELATWAAREVYDGTVTPTEVKAALKNLKHHWMSPFVLIALLGNLCDVHAVVAVLEDIRQSGRLADYERALFGFHQYVLPFMTAPQIDALRASLMPIDPKDWKTHHLAAMLGMHEPLLKIVEAWTDGPRYGRVFPQLIVLGLGSAGLVEQHMRRLQLPLNEPYYIRAWLAHTETHALDYVRDSIQAMQKKESAAELLEAFCLVRAPEAAKFMLEFRLRSDTSGRARQWFSDNPVAGIAGLLPVLESRGKLAEAAAETLWEIRQAGHEAEILAALEKLAESDKAAAGAARRAVFDRDATLPPPFDEAATPGWLKPHDDAAKPKALPAWIEPATLPPLIAEGHLLTAEQVRLVISALQRSTLSAVDPLLVELKKHSRPEHREAFAWKIFDRWQADGAPSPHKWAMHALGLLGSDGVAIKLAELVRIWPSESLHARAAIGMECLRAIGSEGALMQLDMLARKLRFAGLRAKAKRAMDEIAAERGISREDLEDLVIPDCGLDTRGTREFDLGSQKAYLALDQTMKPMLKDAAGKLRPGLPRITKEDDPHRVAAAKAEWALLKKQVSQVIKAQVDRLKKALANGRRWSLPAFDALCRHPLMRHLLHGEIWGLYGPGGEGPGRFVGAFRLTDEGDWADAADAPFPRPAAPDEVRVGLVHPVHLSESQRQAWGEMLSDYQIISPVPQLSRTMFTLTEAELAGSDIERFGSTQSASMITLTVLKNMGWDFDLRVDGSRGVSYSKAYPYAGVTAVAHQGGSYDQVCFPRLHFVRGGTRPDSFARFADSVRLNKMDPAIVSEAMREIAGAVAAGAK